MNCLFTIDVEAHHGINGFDRLILGKIGTRYYGISKIISILSQFEKKAIFFIDFAGVNTWGKDRYERLCQLILDSGHEVQLHVHPFHFDGGSDYLFDYPYSKQKEYLTKAVELYCEILGYHPLAFRAGRYAADDNTIQILNQLNIKYDFSYHHKHPWCRISNHNIINVSKERDGVILVPTTMITEDRIIYKKFTKYDIEYFTSQANNYILQQIKNSPSIVFTLFAHSWSLLSRLDNGSKIARSKRKENHFTSILNLLSYNGIEFKTIAQLNEDTLIDKSNSDFELHCNKYNSITSFLARNLNCSIIRRRINSRIRT